MRAYHCHEYKERRCQRVGSASSLHIVVYWMQVPLFTVRALSFWLLVVDRGRRLRHADGVGSRKGAFQPPLQRFFGLEPLRLLGFLQRFLPELLLDLAVLQKSIGGRHENLLDFAWNPRRHVSCPD